MLAKETYLKIAARYKVLGDQSGDGRNVYVCQNEHITRLTIAVLNRRRFEGGDYSEWSIYLNAQTLLLTELVVLPYLTRPQIPF